MPPSAEHRSDDEQDHRNEEHRPSRRDAVDRTGHGRQPARAPPGKGAQDRGIDLIGAATGRGATPRHDHPDDHDDDGDDPTAAGATDAARQWRWGTRWTPHALGAADVGRHMRRAVDHRGAVSIIGSDSALVVMIPPAPTRRRRRRTRRFRQAPPRHSGRAPQRSSAAPTRSR